jgi:hypothetical protein
VPFETILRRRIRRGGFRGSYRGFVIVEYWW